MVLFFVGFLFSNVSLMFLWFWHAHLAFYQTFSIVQNIGCTKLEWGQGSTVHSTFQQCHCINNFVVFSKQDCWKWMYVALLSHPVFFVKSMHQLESIKWFFVVKTKKKWGQESQNSFYKLLSVVFVKSMHQLKSIKWFFVVKTNQKLGARIPKFIL